jgi:hypothetical protein
MKVFLSDGKEIATLSDRHTLAEIQRLSGRFVSVDGRSIDLVEVRCRLTVDCRMSLSEVSSSPFEYVMELVQWLESHPSQREILEKLLHYESLPAFARQRCNGQNRYSEAQ